MPPPISSRAGPVSRTGLEESTTARLRSSLQTAVTIGTGSSASRLIWLVGTGSCLAIASITSRTPASPSARPTAAATSAAMTSMSMQSPSELVQALVADAEMVGDLVDHRFPYLAGDL